MSGIGWLDALDVLFLAFLFYQLLLLIRGTRAVQMITGIVVLGLALALSRWWQLRALSAALAYALDYIPLAIIVLFQAELREALASFGRTSILSRFSGVKPHTAIDELADAAWALSGKKRGAIFVLEREQGLKNFIETGVPIDAPLSTDLALAIFASESPLHDGACILREGRIVAASCFLPLTQQKGLDRTLGSRHRAALGMTEETDALTLVVSEESGLISLGSHGQLFRGLSRQDVVTKIQDAMSVLRKVA
ncbi:MAG: diadenylate cyclase CdaA [Acidobacteriota bacterium]